MEIPEDRTRTISMLKAWNLWPLDAKHRDSKHCCCRACFADEEPIQLQRKRKRVALPWELDHAA